jgi:2-polyprenyl-3-methyl-5-hydroxy-6-metoxy-1,4-benzoquinol methylase
MKLMSTIDSNFDYHDYEQADPLHQPLYLDLLLRHLRSREGILRVLDAGCGDGNFTASLAESGLEVTGIDLSQGGIAKARSRYPHVQFAMGSVYDDLCELCCVPHFDAIVSVEVIEHLYSPRQFVRRAYAALRPGGILIVTTPYWGYLKNLVLALTNRMDRALTSLWDGGHIKHWSFKTLHMLLTEQGFEFVAFHGTGRRMPFLWSGMVIVVRRPGVHTKLSSRVRRPGYFALFGKR